MPRTTVSLCLTVFILLMAQPCFGQEKIGVAISGADKPIEQNIRAHLNLDRLSCTTSKWHLRNTLAGTDQQISAALRALGFYQANWTVDYRLDDNEENSCWAIAINVEPGAPTTIANLTVNLIGDGSDSLALNRSLAKIPLAIGDRVHHGHYEEAKRIIRAAAISQGFFDARFTTSRLRVDRTENSATVELVLETGVRYHIGQVTMRKTPLKENFIQGYSTIASGDEFDSEKLIRFQNNLLNSRYFDHVNIDQSEPDYDAKTVDIDIDLAVKRRYESTFGVGYTTDLGPRINYQLRNRRFNEDGDTYQLTTQLSPVQSQVGLQFQQPGKDPINEKTVWSLGWQREDNDTYTSESYTAEASRIKINASNWVRTISLNLLVEDFDIASGGDSVVFLYPGIHYQKTRTNNHRYPTKGWRLTGGIRGGADELLSDTSFVQLQAGAKFILPLLDGRLIGRSTLGTTFIDEFSKFPASLRFYAGGDNSIRGFDYESLGPTNDKGQVIGGKHLLTGSIEYDHRVYKDYSLAAFYDAGSAFDNHVFTLYESVGIGVRWHSPIGTIKVDLAFPLEEESFKLHISMGPDL